MHIRTADASAINLNATTGLAAPRGANVPSFADMFAGIVEPVSVPSGIAADRAATTSATPIVPAVGATVQQMFASADSNGDGKLSKSEFEAFDAGMHPNGPHLTEALTGRPVDGDYMFPIVDQQNEGYVTLEQVMQHGYLAPEAKNVPNGGGRVGS